MATHDIHGLKVDFHSGTEEYVRTLREMKPEVARKIIEHSKESEKSRFLDSKIKHEERDGEDHYSFHHHSD